MAWSLVGFIKGFCTFIFMILHVAGGILLIAGIGLVVYNYPRLIMLDMHTLIMLVLLISGTVALQGISTGVLHQLL